MAYYLAPSLKALGAEVTKTWPKAKPWPTVSIGDGWVGDTSHQARKSDHNPDYSAGGVVRAVDIGIEGRDAGRILKATIGDPRVWYVIHKGRIYSRTYGFESRAYTGSNPHNHHIHISIRRDRAAAVDVKPWLTTAPSKAAAPKPAPATTEETDMPSVEEIWDYPINLGDKPWPARTAMQRAVTNGWNARQEAKAALEQTRRNRAALEALSAKLDGVAPGVAEAVRKALGDEIKVDVIVTIPAEKE